MSALSLPALRPRAGGFTLMELMVVMAIIATLLTLAVPKYLHSLERSREAVLRQDLSVMRDAIDKFVSDQGRYPETLEELAARRYLRRVPLDPITDSAATWVALPPPEGERGGVYDVRSGAPGNSLAGDSYETW
ncbi:type II secretion system protein [Methylibium sp.]|uniref:type II secretion system protein n=1 Tax=Methylibium sp. TaxID=2067992 RepID=UPI003D12C85B